MGEHSVLHVDRLVKPAVVQEAEACGPIGMPRPELEGPSTSSVPPQKEVVMMMEEQHNEKAPLIALAECRICQEEDSLNNLETPCLCSGSLKYAHRKCVQHWCNEKGDTICEICHQTYQPGYTAPRPNPEETTIDIGGGWQISGTPLDLHDPRVLAIAEAERQLLEAEYDDYNSTNATGAAFFRSAALILMGFLLLRHALTMTDADADDDLSTFFSLILLRTVGFLLPCYIIFWAISILQSRRQRQEAAAALAAPHFAFVYQTGESSGVHFAIATPTPATVPTVIPQEDRV